MKTLAIKAKNGDGKAFASLIKANEASLYRIARSYLDNEADIADAVQDAILSAWENIAALREPKYFRTWLIRILINECYRIIRQRKKTVPLEQVSEQYSAHMDSSNLAFEEMMNVLSESNRTVMVLFYGEDLPVKEIAKITGISEEAVKQRLHRGRKEIKEKYLQTPDEGKSQTGCCTANMKKVTI